MVGGISKIAVAVLAGAVMWGCGGERAMGPEEQVGPPLSKLASHSRSARAVVVATVMQDGSPVSGASVEFARSIAGRATNYQWSGTTGSNGQAMVEIVGPNTSGYYQARAMQGGSMIGRWSSIPINGGHESVVTLPVGGKANVTGSTDLTPKTVFTVRIENVSQAFDFAASGAFAVPAGADGPGPLLPGNAYEFSFDAPPGSKLSFATMFVQSNDLFYAPNEEGIALWDASDNQTSGDVTSQVMLWDAGTEIDQGIGTGADQAPRQAGPNTGAADPNNTVRQATGTNLPAVSSTIRVTITPTSDTGFNVQINNLSGSTTPLAPGVFVIHSGSAPLFTAGSPDRGEGLGALAEDGNPGGLAEAVGARTGVTGPLAPGVFAVHTGGGVLFASGSPDRGEGLEALAEDGNPGGLASAIAGKSNVVGSGAFAVPEGSDGPGPLFPGSAYVFSFSAPEGSRLSFATMFVQSNDLFYAPNQEGINLWRSDGSAIRGNITSMIQLWDAGTEVDQPAGIGLDQAPRQSGPNTGAADPNNTVRAASDERISPVDRVIRVTITPAN